MGDSLEGMRLTPGMTVLKLAHHSTLWAEVELYENDLRHVREGSRVSVEVDAFPGRRWSGKVLLLRPALNAETRTLTALVEVANPDLRLRPQMFATVTARLGGASDATLVPAQAVLHSGERAVVIVAKGGGLFEPREVGLGLSAGEMQQVTRGLTPGEMVVTSSQFLIDSESNLRAAISQLLGSETVPVRTVTKETEALPSRNQWAISIREPTVFERIIDWSIRNKFLVLLGTAAIVVAGFYAMSDTPLDAIPDLSDVQVIVYTEYPGQAPRIVEDQVTYPLTTQMLAAPFAKVVRGYSFFGLSFVYVIFEDGTDIYWARSRVLEYLNYASGRLPPGVTPTLGPDATGVGWAFMYALKSDRHDLSELRSIQDWFLKYELTSVPGVAEVASVGGFVRQYQITVDPNKLRAYDIPISRIRSAVQSSNSDVGGRLLEVAEKEFMIRGLGYIESVDDIRKIALGVDRAGTPILLRDVAHVSVGPEMRRGLADWNGEGETVGGIVVVRYGADTRQVVADVRTKLAEVKAGLPEGVEIEVAYDRSALIDRAVDSLQSSLTQQFLIVGLVCLVFLFHLRSGLVAIITLPVGILMAFIAVRFQGLKHQHHVVGGIAVAIGTMVDAGIVMVENAHKHLARDRGKKPHWRSSRARPRRSDRRCSSRCW